MAKFEVSSGQFKATVEAPDHEKAYRVALMNERLPEFWGEVIRSRYKSGDSVDSRRKVVFILTSYLFRELGIQWEPGPRKNSLRIVLCNALEIVSFEDL